MKHIVYKFDDGQSDEVDFDAHGHLTFMKGDIVSRRGTTWKIYIVEVEESPDLARIPTYSVYLTRV